jgi:hypothetical protein
MFAVRQTEEFVAWFYALKDKSDRLGVASLSEPPRRR